VSWRLFLPQEWIDDHRRRQQALIPAEAKHQTKAELALDLLEQAHRWELAVGTVLADSEYGNDFAFRQTLRARHLSYAVAVEPTTVVWLENPQVPLPPPRRQGRPRRHPRLEDLPPVHSLEQVARQVPQTSRFALVKVWAAHGWRKRNHPARVVEWLVIQWPKEADAPCDYWMFWEPATSAAPSWLRAVHAARGRWRIEQDYRELKDELGLDHFEGRGWLGWHHHVTLVSLAFAFLRREQARVKKNFWGELADDATPPPSGADPHRRPMSLVSDPFQ
jgi:SRSO17 transposase